MEQARSSDGRFAGGAEGAARNAGRMPVQPHNGARSVNTHVSAKQEKIAINKGVDARYGRRNIYHGS
jgi:hypothetical protein